jgi:hypothetical protein
LHDKKTYFKHWQTVNMMKLEFPGIVGSGELYLKVMKAICGDVNNKSMADLLCHRAPYTPLLGFKDRLYVDIQDRGLDHKEEQQYFIKSDIWSFLVENSNLHCDVMICSDGIEHLPKQQGYDLALTMKLMSDKQIIFTPLGEYMISEDNNPDSHRSGWVPDDLPDWATIVFPDFHPALNTGAFFAWSCENIEQDFERVKNELQL